MLFMASGGGEARKSLGILLAQLRHAVIGPPRQFRCALRPGKYLRRRRRHGKDLHIVLTEHIHHPETFVEVGQHRNRAHALAEVFMVSGDLKHVAPVRLREDVIVDVDFLHRRYLPIGSARPWCRRSS